MLIKGSTINSTIIHIIDILTLLNSYETHILLTIIWRYLKNNFLKFNASAQKPLVMNNAIEKGLLDQMKIIFQKNIKQLAHLYIKFFKDSICTTSDSTSSFSKTEKEEKT